jgi:hypothetical protein
MGAGGHAGERELRDILFVALTTLLGGLIVGFMLFVAEDEIFTVLVGGRLGLGR